MHYSYILAASGLLAGVSGHGLVTSIQGANGVTMPGLSGKNLKTYKSLTLLTYTNLTSQSPTVLRVTAPVTAVALRQTLASFATAR
jgi:hypothetical protein